MYATLEKPSNLANKINFEQKQDFQLVFNLVWAFPLDTDQKSWIFLSVSLMKAKTAPPKSTTFWPPQWCVLVVNKSTDSAKPHLIY